MIIAIWAEVMIAILAGIMITVFDGIMIAIFAGIMIAVFAMTDCCICDCGIGYCCMAQYGWCMV